MAREIKQYAYNGLAGCVEQHKARETGRVVSIVRNDQAKLDDNDGEYPYSTICDEHGFIVAHHTLALARRHATNPLGWCEVCNGQVCERCGRYKIECTCDDERDEQEAQVQS